MGSVEADDERQITSADDWQLQRLAHAVLLSCRLEETVLPSSTTSASHSPAGISGRANLRSAEATTCVSL